MTPESVGIGRHQEPHESITNDQNIWVKLKRVRPTPPKDQNPQVKNNSCGKRSDRQERIFREIAGGHKVGTVPSVPRILILRMRRFSWASFLLQTARHNRGPGADSHKVRKR